MTDFKRPNILFCNVTICTLKMTNRNLKMTNRFLKMTNHTLTNLLTTLNLTATQQLTFCVAFNKTLRASRASRGVPASMNTVSPGWRTCLSWPHCLGTHLDSPPVYDNQQVYLSILKVSTMGLWSLKSDLLFNWNPCFPISFLGYRKKTTMK